MNELTDQDLLRAYAERRSEEAFSELLHRHVDFVHSVAIRMVCDSHLAEDVTQGVFLALARSASQLTERAVLAGWLHRTTRNISAQTVRTDARRRAREQEAAAMKDLLSSGPEPDADWQQIAPQLDAALYELDEGERDAVLLRYFERKSAREMAQSLGTSEEAAQKRVRRAVERLRDCFAKRGITVGAAGLAASISANAVHAAPAGLAAALAASSGLAGAAVTTSVTSTAVKTITMTTLQKALISAAVIAAVATPLALQHQAQVRLAEENAALRRQASRVSQLQSENGRLSNLVAQANAVRKLPGDQFSELLRLRNEVASLRQQNGELAKAKVDNQRLQSARAAEAASAKPAEAPVAGWEVLPKENWAFAGYSRPDSAFLSAIWAMSQSDARTILSSLAPDGDIFKLLSQEPDEKLVIKAKSGMEKVTAIKILDKENIDDDNVILTIRTDGIDPGESPARFKVERVGNEWKLAGIIRDRGTPGTK